MVFEAMVFEESRIGVGLPSGLDLQLKVYDREAFWFGRHDDASEIWRSYGQRRFGSAAWQEV